MEKITQNLEIANQTVIKRLLIHFRCWAQRENWCVEATEAKQA